MPEEQQHSRYGFEHLRRAVIVTPVLVILGAVLIWTLAHTDIVAFATVFTATFVFVCGTFWLTRSGPNAASTGEQASDWGPIPPPQLNSQVNREQYREAA